MQTGIFLSAFLLMASSIIGIGPQNTLLLRQGLAKFYVGRVVAICIVFDAVLITLGVFWVGTELQKMPSLAKALTAIGAGLMLWLAFMAFRSAWFCKTRFEDGAAERCQRRVRQQILLVTVLNPLVWLDTVVLMGSLSAMQPVDGRLWVLLGALSASVLWFGGVGYGARLLAPLFKSPTSWRWLDVAIGCVMSYLAISLGAVLMA